MKCLNKVIAYILILSLFVNMSTTVYGVEENKNIEELNMYEILVVSNEDTDGREVVFYEVEGKYFLDIEDIKELTRCNLSIEEETVTLTQGLREIVIEKATGNMTDSELLDQGNITFFEYDGKYLCEGIPMLKYLGAECRIKDDIKLEVLMPTYTIWEAIMPDYLDYYFNIGELYGGEDNVKFSLICDIIADVLDGVSGKGLMANGDKHLEDALYEILDVDMMKYESVKETVSAQNQKINKFLSSAVFGTSMDTADNMYDAVYEALDYYSKFYISAQNDILLDMMTQTDDLDYASELASQIKKQVYTQSATKANLKNAKKAQSFMDIGMLAFDTAVTSYSMMQYNDDTKNLFARTINQEMFEYAKYYDISWNNVSDKISNTLKSTQSIVANTVIDNVTEFAIEKVTEEGAKMALSAFTSKANIYTAAIQIGSFMASLINYKTNQAFSADMNAIWLSTVQYDIAMLASSLLVRESEDTKFTNAESLEKLKDIFTLYYRTTIAFAENISESLEEFGGKNSQEWIDWFSSTEEKSVANYAAAYLYRITNCKIVPIVTYAELLDNVISADWIEKYKVEKTEDIFGKLPSSFGFSSGVGNWMTELNIESNGNFTGQYYDLDMGNTGSGYSNGTIYISDFSGKFSEPKKINDYVYLMYVEELKIDGTEGTAYYEDNMRYIVTEPYGMENANELYIYLPGASMSELPEDFLSWSHLNQEIRDTLPSGYYGIYNVGGAAGFVGMDENVIWNKSYKYYYGEYESYLSPNCYGVSRLVFLPKNSAAAITLVFPWREDEQTEFIAEDTMGTGEYQISLDIRDDLSKVTVTLISSEGVDLSPWGGTTDGKLVAEYTTE